MMLTEQSFPGPRAFARYMLQGDRLTVVQVDPRRTLASNGMCIETVLFREACWQAELLTLFPHAVVPRHRHDFCDSVELPLGGMLRAQIGSRTLAAANRGPITANLVRVPRGVWHCGTAGPHGAVWLSFQRWYREPGWIADDWTE